jgi:Spy/CpxP family protein refolding chaperone
MKAKWMVALVATTALFVAMAAYAAETAKKAPAPPAKSDATQVAATADDSDDLALDLFGDEGDEDFAMGGHGMGPMGHGPGMGMGRGQGMGGGMGCDEHCRMGGGMGMRHGRGMGRGPGMGPGGGMAGAFAKLDLTDDQREKLAAVHEKQQRKNVQARADLEIARLDLQALMKAEKPNTSTINTQIDKIAKMQGEMRKSQVGALLEARALLTPEQQKQLREARLHGKGMGPGAAPAPPAKPGEGM